MRSTSFSSDVIPLYPAPLIETSGRGAPWGAPWVDIGLICIFLLGLYTHYTIQFSPTVPFPSAPAGLAGIAMLWRHRHQLTPHAATTLLGVVLLYLLSILCATDLSFLARRFNGFIQLVYSIVIGFGLFLTATSVSRRQLAGIFLCFSLVILIGCLLEDYGGLRQFSDSVRQSLYSAGIYDADYRDELLYGRIRPKFFASEPASVTFTYSLFSFIWLAVSRWRGKLLVYFALIGIGAFAMPGPTLLLMVLLILPYALFIASSESGSGGNRLDASRFLKIACLGAILIGAAIVMANTLFTERLNDITAGNDASFFYRVRGPALAARYIAQNYPIAGAGLTGEPYIEREIANEYLRSPAYSRDWPIVSPATELVINFFFLHWIYLGLVWGSIMIAAVTLWLRAIGIPSAAFCWLVWAILGQASGAYVGPLAWAVLYLAGAAALSQRQLEPSLPRSPFRPRWPVFERIS